VCFRLSHSRLEAEGLTRVVRKPGDPKGFSQEQNKTTQQFSLHSARSTSKEAIPTKEANSMALYMDINRQVEGLTEQATADAHARDLEVQEKYGVKYLRYWFDEGTGTVFRSEEHT